MSANFSPEIQRKAAIFKYAMEKINKRKNVCVEEKDGVTTAERICPPTAEEIKAEIAIIEKNPEELKRALATKVSIPSQMRQKMKSQKAPQVPSHMQGMKVPVPLAQLLNQASKESPEEFRKKFAAKFANLNLYSDKAEIEVVDSDEDADEETKNKKKRRAKRKKERTSGEDSDSPIYTSDSENTKSAKIKMKEIKRVIKEGQEKAKKGKSEFESSLADEDLSSSSDDDIKVDIKNEDKVKVDEKLDAKNDAKSETKDVTNTLVESVD